MPAVTCRRARRAFTLTEIMVALTLLGFVAGAILGIVSRQQRFYAGASELIDLRENLRTVANLLPAELRPLAPAQGDLVALSDSAIEFLATTGTGIVCTMDPGRTTVVLPPHTLATNAGLTSWASAPAMGDLLVVYDAAMNAMTSHLIHAANSAGSCPNTTGFTTTVGEASQGVSLSALPALSATITIGAPVRILRRVRYSLYRSPTDRRWYLGYRDFNSLRSQPWSTIQPVSGPFLPHASGGAGGIVFTFFDAAGSTVTTSVLAASVRRIDVTARGETRSPVRTPGLSQTTNGHVRDSVRVSVALRNR